MGLRLSYWLTRVQGGQATLVRKFEDRVSDSFLHYMSSSTIHQGEGREGREGGEGGRPVIHILIDMYVHSLSPRHVERNYVSRRSIV